MKKWFVIFILIGLVIAIAIKIHFDTNVFKVNTVHFQSNKIPEESELTVLQISDLHNKVFGDDNEDLINTIKSLNTEIVVITGDLIDRDTVGFEDVLSLMENITKINNNVYYVSGNHEWENDHTEDFFNGLQKKNVAILNNRNTQITTNELTLNLVGIDDASTNHEDINQAFNDTNQEPFTILLSHSPGVLDRYNDIPADLILCGHTHGGQVRLPFIGALVAPDQGFFPKFDKGTFEIDENQFLYIDSGLGTSVAPIRFLNKSQISLIKITNES
ncbi:metallophosphoesterase [Tenuibacillus multivorans]|uniref:Calcineurin-like phosphoesterase domain-containing protein n=1 Tax=Tenuibacillus multivorans TaxID=237069 RepID=A0A1H0DZF7_9BACI|nr:metallophosphoesterase [Tenuibacillus multivorans]GEL76713.1 phosphoesterase [Tenuibacillus multivorans]SDN75637.1 hypothetical protein SAMN05216498_3007 [Tenuibacillus multivorans]